jgi:hypothetical protein
MYIQLKKPGSRGPSNRAESSQNKRRKKSEQTMKTGQRNRDEHSNARQFSAQTIKKFPKPLSYEKKFSLLLIE